MPKVPRHVLKRFLPVVWLSIAGVAAWVLVQRIEEIDFADVMQHLGAVPTPIMVAALLCSAGVYTTVGLYEGIAVRLASGRNLRRQAFRTAVIANPIGRAIGVAMVSGGALRYRMYAPEGLSIREVGAVILLVAMPYVFGVGWLIDISLLLHLEDASRAFQIAGRRGRNLRRARPRQGRRLARIRGFAQAADHDRRSIDPPALAARRARADRVRCSCRSR